MDRPEFSKYHGLGNDYIVLEPGLFELDEARIRLICDRNRGVGSDGILLGELGGPVPLLRIFNPDGSEAEKSGNGLRIFARWLWERGLAPAGADFPIRTAGGRVLAAVLREDGSLLRVDMGRPDFSARALGLAPALLGGRAELVDSPALFGGVECRITCVSMGNPHCVVLGPPPSPELARALGPLVESDPLFPRRTNVQFLEVLSREEIRVEIWERGAGYTLASGSSSCAAAAAARRLGLVGDGVAVRMPGGELRVEFRGGSALMTGPVEKCFEGGFSGELRARLGLGPAPGARPSREAGP